MPQTFHLALLIHAHQPCGNFEHVLEKAYDDSYLPFLECLEEHPDVRLGLHYSGPLLTWIEKHRPEYFDRLRKLVQSGQVELVGGGFYEPILVSIPPEDQLEQITRLACYLEKHFGPRPTGAYIAEDRGKSVWLYPGQKALRYLVPFGKVEDVLTYLRDAASVHPGGVAAMGD